MEGDFLKLKGPILAAMGKMFPWLRIDPHGLLFKFLICLAVPSCVIYTFPYYQAAAANTFFSGLWESFSCSRYYQLRQYYDITNTICDVCLQLNPATSSAEQT